MKKITAILLALLLCLSFAACGNTNKAEVTPTPEATPTATPEPTEEPTEEPLTLEAYIAGIQSEIDEMTAAMAAEGMSIEILARENSLVYSYKYQEDVADAETMRAALEEATEAQASVFQALYTQLKGDIPALESITVEYLAADGTVLSSSAFN